MSNNIRLSDQLIALLLKHDKDYQIGHTRAWDEQHATEELILYAYTALRLDGYRFAWFACSERCDTRISHARKKICFSPFINDLLRQITTPQEKSLLPTHLPSKKEGAA